MTNNIYSRRQGGVGVDKTITKTNSKTTNICSMPWTGRSKQEQKQNSQQYFKNKDQQCSMPWTGLCKQEQKQLLH